MTDEYQNRQQRRIQEAITNAFIQLIHNKGYESLTVIEIAETASIGRTTFYRYFQNKAQILVHLHKKRFDKLQIVPEEREQWFSNEPSPKLIELLYRSRHQGRFKARLYQLGAEITYIQYLIDDALSSHFQAKLEQSFMASELNIPIAVLARSQAGIFSWMLKWWIQDSPDLSPEDMAKHMLRLIRTLVRDALINTTHESTSQTVS